MRFAWQTPAMRWLVLLSLTGCVSAPHVAPPPAPALAHGGSAPEIVRLVDEFYGSAILPSQARARAAELLQRWPDAAMLHEVAGYAAMLDGDNEASGLHFLAAAADLDSDATELYLEELPGDPPRAQAEATMRVLDQLRLRHPRAEVRARAAWKLAIFERRYGLGAADALVDALGFVRDWQMAGTFDNDQGKGFLNVFPPEEKIDLAAALPGPLVPLHWRKVERLDRFGAVPLDSLLWPRESAVAYLATWVHSDRERVAVLRLGSSVAARAFCNGALVLSEERISGGDDFDNLNVSCPLHAGWNQILVKSANKHGRWRVRARLTDLDGAPLADLRTSAQPQPFIANPAAASTALLPLWGSPASALVNRHRFILARACAYVGAARDALAPLQELLAEAPGNVIGRQYAAFAHWDNEELGKAIDLFNETIADTKAKVVSLLLHRARYYEQKQLWEKAQSDLDAAVALSPRARAARSELAELYRHRGWQTDRCRVDEELLQKWPDFAHAMRDRVECLEALGYEREAERELERATSIEPGLEATWNSRLRLAWTRADLAAARRLLPEVERLDPTQPEWIVEEGDLLRRLGRPDEAKLRFEAAAKMAPEWPTPYERLGGLAWERGRRDEALEQWKLGAARDPNNSAVAQRIEFLAPTKLGFIERFVPTDAEFERALAQKPKPHPGGQSALLLDHEVTEVNADGSARRVVSKVEQALDEHGRDALTHERLPGDGTLKILRAFSLSPTGERQEASSIRGGEVRFRTLAVGSKTVIQYIHYRPPAHFLPGAFVSPWFFQGVGRQHEESTWVIVLARGQKLHVSKIGPVEEKEELDGDRRVLTFHAAHLPPLVQEQHMPPAIDLIAQVEVSTVDGWDDYVRWERALLVDAFRSDPKLDALVDKIMEGSKSPREKLDKLYHYAAQDVRYQQDYENTIAGVRPHAAPVVVERGYGDCKDKAVLLIQMARRAGLKLQFAILRTTGVGKVRREVPNQQFNHAIVWVPSQAGIEQPFFMDPTSDGLDVGNLREDDQGAAALVMDPETGKYEFKDIPYQAPELSYDRHKVRIDVKSPTEAVASDELSLRGSWASALRRLLRNQALAQKLYEQLAAMIFPGTTMKSAHGEEKEDTWHPLQLALELDVSSSIRAEEASWRLSLPGTFRLAGVMALKQRENPLRLGVPDSSSVEIEALVPDGYKFTHAPVDFTVEHACFSVKRKAQLEPRRLRVTVAYTRKCTDVEIADYAGFRDAVQRAMHHFADEIVFAKAR
jgi:tetratricopeptide (TPR) repeat protein